MVKLKILFKSPLSEFNYHLMYPKDDMEKLMIFKQTLRHLHTYLSLKENLCLLKGVSFNK